MTRTHRPRVIALTMSTAWTHRNGVGALSHAAPSHARSSATIARANRGHTTTLNTPAATSTHAENLEITPPSEHTPGSHHASIP